MRRQKEHLKMWQGTRRQEKQRWEICTTDTGPGVETDRLTLLIKIGIIIKCLWDSDPEFDMTNGSIVGKVACETRFSLWFGSQRRKSAPEIPMVFHVKYDGKQGKTGLERIFLPYRPVWKRCRYQNPYGKPDQARKTKGKTNWLQGKPNCPNKSAVKPNLDQKSGCKEKKIRKQPKAQNDRKWHRKIGWDNEQTEISRCGRGIKWHRW